MRQKSRTGLFNKLWNKSKIQICSKLFECCERQFFCMFQVQEPPISRSSDNLASSIASPSKRSGRFNVVRVKKMGFEDLDPLSESSEGIEITVSALGRNVTCDDLLRQRASSYRRGRFNVVCQRPAFQPIPEESGDDDDLLKF